jgi:hypothetical protein
MKTMAKQRPAPHRPNYFQRMERPGKDDHPIYLAVHRRMPQETARERRLARLEGRVRAQLGEETEAFLALETLRADISSEREEAYFNVGYEHGLAEGVARARRAAHAKRARQLAREVRERIAQAQLPQGQAVLVLVECLYAALLSGSAEHPASR